MKDWQCHITGSTVIPKIIAAAEIILTKWKIKFTVCMGWYDDC